MNVGGGSMNGWSENGDGRNDGVNNDGGRIGDGRNGGAMYGGGGGMNGRSVNGDGRNGGVNNGGGRNGGGMNVRGGRIGDGRNGGGAGSMNGWSVNGDGLADKGIRSNICQEVLEGNDIIPGRCVFHMLQNCPGAKGSKLVRRLVLELAKSSTHEGYLLKLEELSRRGLTDVATWFNARRKQYATYCKFSSSYNCFKSINSNPHILHFKISFVKTARDMVKSPVTQSKI
jgi:hypothetical protein